MEAQFYTHFNDYQIVPDTKNVWNYDKSRSVIGELNLANDRFFPFLTDQEDTSDFIFNMFRATENFDVINDKFAFFVELKPIVSESTLFFIKSNFQYKIFKMKLVSEFYKYLFNHKIQKDWKAIGDKHFRSKLQDSLFETKAYFMMQSKSKAIAEGRVRGIFNNFLVFKNYPLNQFKLKMHRKISSISDIKAGKSKFTKHVLNSHEIASFFHFPKNPSNETSLLTVIAKKLALPVGVPTFDYTHDEKKEVFAKDYPDDVNIVGVSDYRSTRVPIGIYDEDRLRHMYVVGKTGTGKSKFLQGLMVNDIAQGKGI